MSILRRLAGYRYVEIRQDDSLQAIAQRELGDASRWADIIAINDLLPPYLTGDVNQASANVRLFGEQLIVPAVAVQTSAASDPDRVFGVDIALTNGLLEAENGDFRLARGDANLRQALLHRVRTALGELLFHAKYGCNVHALIGRGNGPTVGVLGAEYVRGALLSDPRVDSVDAVTASIIGDVNEIEATVRPIAGTSIDIQTTV